MRRYPIGIQSFLNIITGDYLYVDKTDYVFDLAQNYKYVFLSRPRRFGKSLLTSTLEYYFLGRKDLFKGLKADELEKEWNQYPVLHFDLSGATVGGTEELKRYLSDQLNDNENKFGIVDDAEDMNLRLKRLIQKAKAKTGMPVVVLIDEYDKPLLDVLSDNTKLDDIRLVMRNFYSPLKACEGDLRFVFITGITKFSQLSIFSELNNLTHISMNPKYAAICGVTKEELLSVFNEGITKMAEENEMTKDECIDKLAIYYDGYHFSRKSPDIYNPFSLLQALKNMETGYYWFSSATPTFLINQMKRFGVKPQGLGKQRAWESSFDTPTENMKSITPLLYQSGYITIKGYDKTTGEYLLDIPNKEVRAGLMESLIPYVAGDEELIPAQQLISDMYRAFLKDDFDEVMELLKTFLGTIPQTDNVSKDYEGYYQSLLYVIFSLMCRYVQVEVRTPRGRADIVLESPRNIYLIEIKLNSSADKAMKQIELKDYPERFALCGKPVVKVGVNFSAEMRNIADWEVME